MSNEKIHLGLYKFLRKIGLPQDPLEIIGRRFQLVTKTDDGAVVMIGTIEGIKFSLTNGLELIVTNLHLQGALITGLKWDETDKLWRVKTDDCSRDEYREGNLTFL